MTKRGLLLSLKAALSVLAIGSVCFMVWAAFWGDIVVRRNETQVVEIVGRQLERMASEEGQKKNAAAKNLRIKRIEVSLANNITVTAEVEGRRFAQAFSATVHAVGTPDYRQKDNAFFFVASEFKVLAFSYKGSSVAEKATGLVRRITRNEEANNLAAELAPKLEEWVTHLAEASVKNGLERFPVYRIKDDMKGWLIKAGLKSVDVKNGEIVAVVSITQITWTVIGYFVLFLAICAVIVGLFIWPEALLGIFWSLEALG